MYKVAVIGDSDSVIGFRALGMAVHVAETEAQAKRAYRLLSGNEYAVIFVTEPLAPALEYELAEARNKALPAVILIPSAKEETSYGMQDLRDSVRRATGMDLLASLEQNQE